MVPAPLPSDSSCTGWRGCNIHGLPVALDEQRLWNKPHTCGTPAGTDLSAGVSVRMALSRLSGPYFWIQTLKFPAFVDTASPWQLLSIAAPSPGAFSHSPCSSGEIHGCQVPWGGKSKLWGAPPGQAPAELPGSGDQSRHPQLHMEKRLHVPSRQTGSGNACIPGKRAAGEGAKRAVRPSPPTPSIPPCAVVVSRGVGLGCDAEPGRGWWWQGRDAGWEGTGQGCGVGAAPRAAGVEGHAAPSEVATLSRRGFPDAACLAPGH